MTEDPQETPAEPATPPLDELPAPDAADAPRGGSTLYSISTRQVVSKYIGETEKNLNAVFRPASQVNMDLYVDDGDDLLGR